MFGRTNIRPVKNRPNVEGFLSYCFTSTEARWPIRNGDRVGRGRRLDHGNRPKNTGETVDRRQNIGSVKAVSLAIAQRLVHCAVAVSTAVLDSH